MITPFLEQKILCGDAVWSTFNAGGSEKTVLSVRKGTFIIITGITYFSRVPDDLDLAGSYNAITQLTVCNERRENHFVFRNMISTDGLICVPCGTVHIDTYLVFDSDVIFSFTDGQDITLAALAPTPVTGEGVNYPIEYGKTGQRAPKQVHLTGGFPLPIPAQSFQILFGGPGIPNPPGTRNVYNELTYPPINVANNDGKQIAIPLAQIQYVNIKGTPSTAIAGNN